MREEEEIMGLLKDFHAISGFRVSIHDPEYNEIYSYPKKLSAFCTAVQSAPGGMAACKENDRKAFTRAKKSGSTTFYRCHCGLTESVTPIYNFGELTVFLMIGQTADESPETDKRILAAGERFMDTEQARKLCAAIPRVKEELLTSYISLMTVIAGYITKTNKLHSGSRNMAALVREYINLNYAKKISLDTLCRKFDCCKSTLMTDFKKTYGVTVNAYLTGVRLSQAERQLVKTTLSVKEIASSCGFTGQNYFSRVFGEKYGISPTDYRKKLRNEC